MRIAKVESFTTTISSRALPPGEGRLGFMDLVSRQAIEVVITGVEGADVIEAEPLPASAISRDAIGEGGTELAVQGAAGVGACTSE